MTPVPGDAGLSNTRPPPNSPITSCGMVLSRTATVDQRLLRRVGSFANRFGNFVCLAETAADFPGTITGDDERAEAEPTSAFHDFRAAVDEYDLFSQAGFIRLLLFVSSRISASAVAVAVCGSAIVLKLQSAFACGIGQGFNFAVIRKAAPIEDDFRDVFALARSRQQACRPSRQFPCWRGWFSMP